MFNKLQVTTSEQIFHKSTEYLDTACVRLRVFFFCSEKMSHVFCNSFNLLLMSLDDEAN